MTRPAWISSVEDARNLTGPGLVALCQTLLDDLDTPPSLCELARRFLDASLYRDDRPRSRTGDPETSQVAADAVKARGPALPGRSVHRILKAYDTRASHVAADLAAGDETRHGLTSREVEEWTGIKAAHKRTSELLRDGLLEVVRTCDYVDEGDDVETREVNPHDLVRDGGRVLRITDAGRTELARLDAAAARRREGRA